MRSQSEIWNLKSPDRASDHCPVSAKVLQICRRARGCLVSTNLEIDYQSPDLPAEAKNAGPGGAHEFGHLGIESHGIVGYISRRIPVIFQDDVMPDVGLSTLSSNKRRSNHSSAGGRNGWSRTATCPCKITLHSIDHGVPAERDLVQVEFDIVDGRQLVEVNPSIQGEGSGFAILVSMGRDKYGSVLLRSISTRHRIAGAAPDILLLPVDDPFVPLSCSQHQWGMLQPVVPPELGMSSRFFTSSAPKAIRLVNSKKATANFTDILPVVGLNLATAVRSAPGPAKGGCCCQNCYCREE